jgi:hypothetical protein
MPRGRRGNRDARGELVSVLSCGFTCFHVVEEVAIGAGNVTRSPSRAALLTAAAVSSTSERRTGRA